MLAAPLLSALLAPVCWTQTCSDGLRINQVLNSSEIIGRTLNSDMTRPPSTPYLSARHLPHNFCISEMGTLVYGKGEGTLILIETICTSCN